MGNHTQLITSFRDYIPSCPHGIKLDKNCPDCETERNNEPEWRKFDRESEIQEKEKTRLEYIESHKNNPEKYMDYVIPLKFRSKSFENFNGNDNIKKILKEYSDGFIVKQVVGSNGVVVNQGLLQYPGSVLLTGKTGCGKTHLAVSIYRSLIERCCDVPCKFITTPELLLEIRSTFGGNKKRNSWEPDDDTSITEEEVIDKYSGCGLLILDDLGSEKTSDFTIQTLYLIIDRRNRNLKPTIITTNLSLEEIEEKIDARMASRLSDMKVIKLNMPDYRKKRG
jgi:DNA replication protein DnaC